MIEEFLQKNGWANAKILPLAEAGASLRNYRRVISPTGRSAILTLASDPELEITKFSQIAGILRAHGLSAPEIYAADVAASLMLQEDFGNESYASLIKAGQPALPLALQAIDVLCQIQNIPQADLAAVPAYNFELWYSVNTKSFAENLLNFYEHYLPCIGAKSLSVSEIQSYKELWQKAFDKVSTNRQTLLLRDFKFANQMHLPQRAGVKATGLIDFQDAGIGTPYYDLVETCEPWTEPAEPQLRSAVLARYLAAIPGLSADELDLGLKTITALRWVAWLSNCARYARQGRPQYLAHIPRIWKAVERNLATPELAELRDWFDQYAPMHLRAPTQVAA
jgi:N-acetylmuramate 1-kinase